MASSFPSESNQSFDSTDEVPSSWIGAACQFHEKHYQHYAFSVLFCPIQTALQIILSELQILLMISFLFKEVMNIPLFGQNSFPVHFIDIWSNLLRTYSCFWKSRSPSPKIRKASRETAIRTPHDCGVPLDEKEKTRGKMWDSRMNNKNEGKPNKHFEMP